MDFNNPTLNSLYADMVEELKQRDSEIATWLVGDNTNVPLQAKRWNSASNRFESFNGTSWVPLADRYGIDVESVDGCSVDDSSTSSNSLWTANKINTALSSKLNANDLTASTVLNLIKTVDGAGSGLDADTVDGYSTSSSTIANTVVLRDASGNFNANTITATLNGSSSSCSGNSATATKLATARTISLSGSASGSASFDGSGNITLSVGIADNSHYHQISNVTGLQNALDSKLSSVPAATSSTLGGVRLNFVAGTLYITN